ncbi:YkgJ family cysteine cluster protein [Desulfofundulus thermobenzoicus]|uniref:YkgJ family cysteine cluster protein n=1 Tax=Desulfofundulus thermobenzoicus TaxID=29376 RepID=A0A6N7IRV4_9FIRM|nr:YkgJ family cysteine cluster protein [Desulfofundulus thermobenzoicus]MQL52239.1 YkgJ family cysteine cluster protein [Desulfofundulus thermobenzoicus]
MKVRINHCLLGGKPAYDVQIIDRGATVRDYLDALNDFIREHCPPCNGCTACCWERVPLTFPDVAAFLRDEHFRRQFRGHPSPLLSFLRRYGYVYVEGPVVDIGLGFRPDGSCIFLDARRGRCSIYRLRPMVCQTYICRLTTRRAAALRSLVVNAGMDELVRRWLAESRRCGEKPVMHEAIRPRPRPADYPAGAFGGAEDFACVPLKKLCPSRLWRSLYHDTRESR